MVPTNIPTVTAQARPGADALLSTNVASIGSPRKVWSLGGFVTDLRKPRAPKVRSERPTTGADGIEAMITASLMKMMLSIDMHRSFLAVTAASRPLTGHYRSLLRPPSLCG